MKGGLVHPREALSEQGSNYPLIPVCDHYAGSERFIRKAFELTASGAPVFDITCDLEDGSGVGNETQHAKSLAEVASELWANRAPSAGRVGLRIHDPQHPAWTHDLRICAPLMASFISYITIPKVRSVSDVRRVAALVRTLCGPHRSAQPPALHVLIETPQALREVWEIAALPEVQCLEFGLLDFISEHRGVIPESCMRSPGQFEHRLLANAKVQIVEAAVAHHKVASHNITVDISNPAAARSDACRAREEFGFLRMWSIHPSQIPAVVEGMTSARTELERASAILLTAQRADWKPIRYEETLHDRASYRHYWWILRRAKMNRVDIPAAAQEAFFAESKH